MNQPDVVSNRLDVLAQRPFRAKFHLGEADKALVQAKGLATIRRHADELLSTRLFPALPPKDGKQTPYRGHPVFVAQHATATCCRKCLMNWHKLSKGQELTPAEQAYVLDVIETWIKRELRERHSPPSVNRYNRSICLERNSCQF